MIESISNEKVRTVLARAYAQLMVNEPDNFAYRTAQDIANREAGDPSKCGIKMHLDDADDVVRFTWGYDDSGEPLSLVLIHRDALLDDGEPLSGGTEWITEAPNFIHDDIEWLDELPPDDI